MQNLHILLPKVFLKSQKWKSWKRKKLKKNLQRYFCIPCDFKCCMKCDWDRHIMRAKHLKCINGNNMETKKLKKTYNCHCGKHFLSNSGLWKHQNKCLLTNDSNQNKTNHNEPTDKGYLKKTFTYF